MCYNGDIRSFRNSRKQYSLHNIDIVKLPVDRLRYQIAG